MSTQIKTKEDPDSYTFECTSELILENDVIKVEVDGYYEQEESVKPPEIKSESSRQISKSPFTRWESSRFCTKHFIHGTKYLR